MTPELLPCPFCGGELFRSMDIDLPYFYHVNDGCILRNRAWYMKDDAAKWNTRSLATQETPDD